MIITQVCVCIHCLNVCTYMFASTYMHACLYVCIDVCMYVSMHVGRDGVIVICNCNSPIFL